VAFVVLIGGSGGNSGNIFARNPTTGIYGPVCDDNFGIVDVSDQQFWSWKYLTYIVYTDD
jgi:hypothetical protein